MIREYIEDNKRKLIFLLVGCTMLLIGAAIYNKCESEHREEAESNIEKAISKLTFTEAERKEELWILNELAQNNYIGSDLAGKIYENIAALYMLDNDSSMYIFSSGYAIYLYKEADMYEKSASVCIDIAKYLSENYELKVSENIVADTVLTEMKSYLQSPYVKRKAYMTLADIYSKSNDFEKAMESAKKARKFIDKTEESQFYDDCLTIIEARAYLQAKKYDKAKQLLDKVRKKYYYNNTDASKYVLTDYMLPFLEIDAKIKMHEKKYDEALELSEKYLSFCDEFHYETMKLNMMVSIAELGESSKNSKFSKMKEEAWKLYPKVIDERNSHYAENMMDSVAIMMENLSNGEYDFRMRQRYFISIVVLLVLVFLVGKQLKHVWIESCFDQLTNVFNRRQMNRIYTRLRNKNKKYGCIMLDVDNFKRVNDTYGHQQGDEVLVQISKTIKRYSSKNNIVSRYGGEEFLILVQTEEYEKIAALAEKVRLDVENIKWKEKLHVTISLGTAASWETEEPIELADKRLYYSKTHGKNCVTSTGLI